jgi:raffinose/stachyose/melibiose transport system permease protein
MGSYVISRKIVFGWKFLGMYYLIGLMIPAYGMLIPVMRMFTWLGLRNQYVPMILLYAGINFPMSFFLIINYMNGLSREIDEAAAIDGCGLFTTVFRIIFPIAQPGIFTAAIINFLAVYNELIFSNTLLQKKTMQTISVTLLSLRGERFTSWGSMFASIVLSIVPIMVIYILFQSKIESGIAAGAVKG